MIWYPGKFNPIKHRKIRVGDLVVLMFNIYQGSIDGRVGFESASETLKEFMRKLNRQVVISVKDLETTLWSCNLLDEVDSFWHPNSLSFDQFLTGLVPTDTFDKKYNYLKEK